MAYQYDQDVNFEVIEHIGVLSEHSTGWRKELNLVSWNGGVAKYDIRDWDPTHSNMSRGITLKEQEMRNLIDSIRKRRTNTARIKRNSESEAAMVAEEQESLELSPENLSEQAENVDSTDAEEVAF